MRQIKWTDPIQPWCPWRLRGIIGQEEHGVKRRHPIQKRSDEEKRLDSMRAYLDPQVYADVKRRLQPLNATFNDPPDVTTLTDPQFLQLVEKLQSLQTLDKRNQMVTDDLRGISSSPISGSSSTESP